MSGIELNKIAAALLLAALIAMIVGVIANALYKPKLQVSTRGYAIEVVESKEGGAENQPEKEIDIAALMASANADAGEKVVKKCLSCHSFDQGGAHKVGPNLWKVLGAKKASKPEFPYSKAMAATEGIWDNESLFAFLHRPGKYVPGTKMSFVGLSNPQDIANVIAYLRDKAS